MVQVSAPPASKGEIINGNGGNDNFNVSGAQPATESLTFNGGIGNDTLSVYDILPNNGVGTTFNAGTGVADQNTLNIYEGTFTFSGDPAAQAANLTINVSSTQTVDGAWKSHPPQRQCGLPSRCPA